MPILSTSEQDLGSLVALLPDGDRSADRQEAIELAAYLISLALERQRLADRLERRHELGRLAKDLAVAANEASTIEDAMLTAVDAVCSAIDWPVGHVSLFDAAGDLVPTSIWHLPDAGHSDRLRHELIAYVSSPELRTRLSEMVVQRRSAFWLEDLRAIGEPTALDVSSAFALPVMVSNQVAAVLEFYSDRDEARDDELLELLTDAGAQLGMAIERKRAQDELQRLNERLEASNRELEEFAAIASHDLQEPLRKILMFGDRLEHDASGQLSESASLYLERMLDATRRMRRLINDLLAFSRVRPSALTIKRLDLSALIGSVIEDLEPQIQNHGADVIVEQLPEILGDELQIRTLFQNLIGNGIKFHHPERPPIVTVCADRHPNDDGGISVHVSDNGIGIEPEYFERIFSLFERLHGRQEFEGTGIGLAICQRIAEHHGGTIRVASEPGCGSTFTVRLPASPEDIGEAA
ncbi:MAG: ATP-binding protein [Thermomicrobiales bacterium]